MVVGVCAHMYKVQNTYIAIMVHGYIDYKWFHLCVCHIQGWILISTLFLSTTKDLNHIF